MPGTVGPIRRYGAGPLAPTGRRGLGAVSFIRTVRGALGALGRRTGLAMTVMALALLGSLVPLRLAPVPLLGAMEAHAQSQPAIVCRRTCEYQQDIPGNACKGARFVLTGRDTLRHVEVVIYANGTIVLADYNGNPLPKSNTATVVVQPDRGCVLAQYDPLTGKYMVVCGNVIAAGNEYALLPSNSPLLEKSKRCKGRDK